MQTNKLAPVKSSPWKAILIYLLFTLLFSTVVWVLTLNEGPGRTASRTYGFALMWCPALATYVTCRILGISIGGLAWNWPESKYMARGYFIPMLYAFAAYLIIWIAGWGGFYNRQFINEAAVSLGWRKLPDAAVIPLFFVVNGVVSIIGGMCAALGEEIGWRGFLVPNLYTATKNNFTATAIISGIIWSVWHYPILIFGHYNNGAPAWYGLTCFSVMVVGISFVFTWFRLRSGSIWTSVMLHASHNLFIQSFFTPITATNSKSMYFIDEFGLAVPAVCVLLAFYFWTRRGELKKMTT